MFNSTTVSFIIEKKMRGIAGRNLALHKDDNQKKKEQIEKERQKELQYQKELQKKVEAYQNINKQVNSQGDHK